ncbi:hypothetical protein GS416_10725 [Rhodococcus hoagii]|nr:hypothetical protein [Prescottella equi]
MIGSGAREHALLLALARDPGVDKLMCAPGNAGIARIARDPCGRRRVRRRRRRSREVAGRRPGRHRPRGAAGPGVADAVRAAGIACFGRPPRPPASRAPRRSPRTSWPPPACARARRGRRQPGRPRCRARPFRPQLGRQGRRTGRR